MLARPCLLRCRERRPGALPPRRPRERTRYGDDRRGNPTGLCRRCRGAGRSPGCSKTSAGSPPCLLLPTVVLLGLFIAYPFVKGVLLSVTDTKVGVPGHFVGLDNFDKIWNDGIFQRRGLEHLPLHVRHDGLQAGARAVAGAAAEPAFPRQGVRARLHPAAVHHPDGAVDLRLEVDVRPDLQRPQLDAVPARPHHGPHQLAGRSRPGDDLGDHRQCLARRAVLRDHAAGRAADDQPRTARGRGDRRRPRLAALPARDLAAAAAGDDGGRAVLGDPDLRRLPARLRADRRRPGQRHPPVRHLRLPDRRRHRAAQRGRGDLAGDLPGAAARGDRPAPLHPPGGDASEP